MTKMSANLSPFLTLVEQGSDPSTPGATHQLLYVKSGGVYVINSSAVVTGPFGTGGGGGGDGGSETRIYGYDDPPVSSTGTWAYQGSQPAGPWGATATYNSSHAQNDQLTWTRYLQAGTYTFFTRIVKNSDHGIATVKIDGSSVGTIDGYAGGSTYYAASITGIVLSTSGSHTIQIIIATKNGSASDYYWTWMDILMVRTA